MTKTHEIVKISNFKQLIIDLQEKKTNDRMKRRKLKHQAEKSG